jgi:hypothetical protein
MPHALLLLILWMTGRRSTSDSPLDLSAIDANPEAIADSVRTGTRYIRQSRVLDDGRVEVSPVMALAPECDPPGGWTGGQDVTRLLMFRVGLSSDRVGQLDGLQSPVPFDQRLDEPQVFSVAKGVILACVVAAAVLGTSAGLYDWERTDFENDLTHAVMLGTMASFFVAPIAILGGLAIGVADRGGPLVGRAWWAALIPIVLPVLGASVGARRALEADHDRLLAALAALDLDGPDQANGFDRADPGTPEIEPPADTEPTIAWSRGENLHSPEVPPYGPGDKGVIVDWTREKRQIADVSVLLPDDLRAERRDDVRWIAYLARPRTQAAFQYDDGTSTSLDWLNIRIVDVRTGALVGHGSAMITPPDKMQRPPSHIATPDTAALAAILQALSP